MVSNSFPVTRNIGTGTESQKRMRLTIISTPSELGLADGPLSVTAVPLSDGAVFDLIAARRFRVRALAGLRDDPERKPAQQGREHDKAQEQQPKMRRNARQPVARAHVFAEGEAVPVGLSPPRGHRRQEPPRSLHRRRVSPARGGGRQRAQVGHRHEARQAGK